MHARVTTGKLNPQNVDDALKLTSDSVVPAAKQQTGFQEYIGLTDRETGKFLIVTIWDSEADMKAGEQSQYYREQIAKVGPYLEGAVATQHYEVSVRT